MNQGVKTALIIGGIILAVLIIVPGIFGANWGGQSSGFGMMGGMMNGFGGMGLMAIVWIVFIGVIIWAIVAAVQNSTESKSPGSAADSALDVLKKRYARGEIDKDEFNEKKKDLI
jgi:putative membrane protein